MNDTELPPHLRPPTRSKAPIFIGVGVVAAALVAFLAFGVFGVHTAFIDEKVSAEDPFAAASGESGTTGSDDGDGPSVDVPATDEGGGGDRGDETTTDAGGSSGDGTVVTGSGTFEDDAHPGEGTVTVGSVDGQPTIHFGDDFATDNGPDLYAAAIVDGERVELGRLEGNQGSQTYELPDGIDPGDVESVQVWCKRFDVVFTEATVS